MGIMGIRACMLQISMMRRAYVGNKDHQVLLIGASLRA